MDTNNFARDKAAGTDTGSMSFPRAGSQTRRHGSESLVDQYSSFKGSFRTSQDFRVEGAYEGDIECEGTLTIAENANVTANVKAQNLIIYGAIHGDIVCDGRLELTASGKLSGRASARVVTIHEGAFYEGELRMNSGLSASSRSAPAFGSRTSSNSTNNRRRESASTPERTPQQEEKPSLSFSTAGRYGGNTEQGDGQD